MASKSGVKYKLLAWHHEFPKSGTCIVEGTDREVFGQPWQNMNGNPTALIYAMRSGLGGLPADGKVYYAKIGAFACLLHESEILGNGKGGKP